MAVNGLASQDFTGEGDAGNGLRDSQRCIDFFQQRLQYLLHYWREHEAVKQLQIGILDRERELILKVISLGLDCTALWSVVRPLILALTPYMERRGHWESWRTVLVRAVAVAQRKEDAQSEITLTALLARLSQRQNLPQAVVYYYRRALRLARRRGNRFEEARACTNLGFHFIDRSRWWRSEVLSRHALAIFEELGSDHGCAHTHNHLGLLFIRTHSWSDAEKHLLTACQLWEAMPDPHSLIYGYENLALLYNEMARPHNALDYLTKAEKLVHETGEEAEVAKVWGNMAHAYRLSGNFVKAICYASKAEEQFHRQLNWHALARVWHNLALVHVLTDNRSLARSYLEKAQMHYRLAHDGVGERQLLDDYQQIKPTIKQKSDL